MTTATSGATEVRRGELVEHWPWLYKHTPDYRVSWFYFEIHIFEKPLQKQRFSFRFLGAVHLFINFLGLWCRLVVISSYLFIKYEPPLTAVKTIEEAAVVAFWKYRCRNWWTLVASAVQRLSSYMTDFRDHGALSSDSILYKLLYFVIPWINTISN